MPRAFFRSFWLQIHSWIGITAGTVLVVIGLSGAVLAFREELLWLLNPGSRQVEAPAGPAVALTPAALADALRQAGAPDVAAMTLYAEPGRPARVQFVPIAAGRRGEVRLADPWRGTLLPPQRGAEFFTFTDRLHRWLLLPRDAGRIVTGTLAIALLVFGLTGLYLRWPRPAHRWRHWLAIDLRLRGRPLLWNLHAVVGT